MNGQMVMQMFSCASKLINSKNSICIEVIMVYIIKILSFRSGNSLSAQYLLLRQYLTIPEVCRTFRNNLFALFH